MLDFDSHQIEKDFSENTIFQVKFALIELEFNMQTFFYPNFHFNRSICVWLYSDVRDNKFFFFCYPIIVSINDHVYVVSQLYHNTIVALKLLFDSVELEVVRHIIRQCAWWL